MFFYRRVMLRGATGLLAFLMFAGRVSGADVTSNLTGQGADSGAPLSATVSIDIANDLRSATFLISNTTSALSGGGIATGIGVAPYIFAYGWNMDGFDFEDLTVSAPQFIVNTTNEIIAVVDWKFKEDRRLASAGRFEFVTGDRNPRERYGVDLSLQYVLSADPGAPDLTADAFLNAPYSTGGSGSSQNAVRFQVVGADGGDSGIANGTFGPGTPPSGGGGGGGGGEPIPEPMTVVLMTAGMGLIGTRKYLKNRK